MKSSSSPHQAERWWWTPGGCRTPCWSHGCIAPQQAAQVNVEQRMWGVSWLLPLPPSSPPHPRPPLGGYREASPELSGLHRSPLPERSHRKGMKGGREIRSDPKNQPRDRVHVRDYVINHMLCSSQLCTRDGKNSELVCQRLYFPHKTKRLVCLRLHSGV